MRDPRKVIDSIRERVDDGGYGRQYGAKETANERIKIVEAQLREDAPQGMNIPDTDAWIRRQPAYIQAVEDKANAFADFKTSETYIKISFAEFDMWRSEEATNRGLDKRSTG